MVVVNNEGPIQFQFVCIENPECPSEYSLNSAVLEAGE
jgi:hypothetical protein